MVAASYWIEKVTWKAPYNMLQGFYIYPNALTVHCRQKNSWILSVYDSWSGVDEFGQKKIWLTNIWEREHTSKYTDEKHKFITFKLTKVISRNWRGGEELFLITATCNLEYSSIWKNIMYLIFFFLSIVLNSIKQTTCPLTLP